MLFLEDFLELIENLPSELRDRFTEIRTLDLQVQNGLDKAEKSVQDFFKVAPSMTYDERQRHFDKIKDDYRKIMEDSDEKVNLATMMHDLVRRYLARLDHEITKFKMELEADSPGITEVLERKVKDAEQSLRVVKKEKTRKRKYTRPVVNGDWVEEMRNHDLVSMLPPNESSRNSSALMNHLLMNGPLGQAHSFKKSQSYPKSLTHVASASSIASQQVSSREKAPNPSGSFLQSFTEHPESRHGRPRKLTSRVSEMLRDVIHKQEQRERISGDGSSMSYIVPTSDDADVGADSADLSDQSDQQRWCICNRVSFGAMVACDDKDCPFEWFHYECVGITQPPKGKWFCPHCTKRRK